MRSWISDDGVRVYFSEPVEDGPGRLQAMRALLRPKPTALEQIARWASSWRVRLRIVREW